MGMEKYSRLIEDFAAANCNVKEDDIMKKVDGTKKRHLRTIAGIAACVALIFIGTTVSAATGLIDLTGLFKKLFNDEVTSELIEEGAVQEVNLTAQNDKYTLTFEGITGDSDTQFGVFKLVDNTGELGNPSLLQVDVKMVGMSVVEEGRLSEYGSCLNDSFTVSEDEVNTFYIKVNLPSYWIYDSQEDIYISLKGVTAYYGKVEYFPKTTSVLKAEKTVEIPFDLECTFTPDRSVFPESYEFTIEEKVTSEFSDFTIKSLDASRYRTDLLITLPNNDNIVEMRDAAVIWHNIDNDYIYKYLGNADDFDEGPFVARDHCIIISKYKDEERLYESVIDPGKYTEGNVKLYVDGVEIKRTIMNGHRYPLPNDSIGEPVYWYVNISFENFDLSTAKSIEIKYKDKTITIK